MQYNELHIKAGDRLTFNGVEYMPFLADGEGDLAIVAHAGTGRLEALAWSSRYGGGWLTRSHAEWLIAYVKVAEHEHMGGAPFALIPVATLEDALLRLDIEPEGIWLEAEDLIDWDATVSFELAHSPEPVFA